MRALSGRSLGEVAASIGLRAPKDLHRQKGWIGVLMEDVLGATATSRAAPDFPHLGVEMKTIPLRPDGRPKESTYVCTAPLDGSLATSWPESWVCRKLSRVLWIPILGDGPPSERRVGRGLFWSPDHEETALLQQDYEELAGMIALGEYWDLTARHGKVLQLRPKGADGAARVWGLGEEGQWVQERPRGFYLRASFTERILGKRLRAGR